MPTYEITAPDGKTYEVSGQGSQEEALQHLQQQLAAANTPADPVAAQAQQEMSAMTQHPGAAIAERQRQQDVADFAAMPAWKRPLVEGIDLVNTAGRSATRLATGAVDLGSRALAATGAGTPVVSMTPEEVVARFRSGQPSGPAFDAEVAAQKRQTEAAKNRLGWAAPIAEAAPLMMAPIAKVAEGLPLLNTALTGAGYGALTAAGDKENPLLGAVSGGAGAAGGHVLGQGLGYVLNKGLGFAGKTLGAISPSLATKTGLAVPSKTDIMTPDEFKTLASHAFDEAESHGVVFNTQGLTHLKGQVETLLRDKGYHPGLQPKIAHVLSAIDDYVNTGNATQRGMQTLRELASGAYEVGNKKNNMFVGQIIGQIDDLSTKMDPRFMSAATNNPKAAAAAAKFAREMYSRGAKLETTLGRIEHARRQGRGNISQNAPQLIQKELLKINDPTLPAVGRGFTQAEKAAADVAAERTGQQMAMHRLAGLMPRDKLSTALTVAPLMTGVMMGGINPVGAAMAIGGTGAKMLIGHMAEKRLQKLVDRSVEDLVHLIASGGAPTQSILQRLTASKRAAVLAGLGRAGMGFGAAAANQLYGANSQNEAANP